MTYVRRYVRGRRLDPDEILLSTEDEDLRHWSKWRVFGYGYVLSTRARAGLLHRIIMARIHGEEAIKGMQVDHINGDKLDNRRENLRLVTQSVNMQHELAPRSHKKSPGPRGVRPSRTPGKWEAYGRRPGPDGKTKVTFLGTFDTMEEAEAAYLDLKRSLPGFIPPEQRAS